MIVTAWKDEPVLEVGQRYERTIWVRGADGRMEGHDMPFVVLREATRKEYIQHCIEHGIERGAISPYRNEQLARFYEVSVD